MTTKHVSNSPVTFVTRERFAVLWRKRTNYKGLARKTSAVELLRLCSHYTGSLFRGGSWIFFRRGCTRLLLYFNTNKPHSFFCFLFCRIPVVLENRWSSRGGGGGAHPLHPPPKSPLLFVPAQKAIRDSVNSNFPRPAMKVDHTRH